MKNNTFNVHRKLNTFLFSFLFLSALSLGSLAQGESLNNNATFGTLASIAEKQPMPATRSRVIPELSVIKAVTKEENFEEEVAPVFKNSAESANNTMMLAFRLEHEAFDILNQRRVENGLAPLAWSEDMAKVARLHSANMAKNDFFSHEGLDGKMVNDRADSLGFTKWRAIGENIAFNHGYDKPAQFACERWMLSVSHRENVLNKRWKEAAVGVSITQDGTYYFTEVFVQK